MTTIVHIDPDTGIITDQGAHIDQFGQVLLIGIFSDLCQFRDDQNQDTLDGIAKRLGAVLERYEP
ncbi:hypothetical protein [Pseudomonas fluvialis]|uniref:hypothetical protein n=1 Tax=Pseudomonas fluvialis TaxID=1793966 RepID=UPI0035ADB9E7